MRELARSIALAGLVACLTPACGKAPQAPVTPQTPTDTTTTITGRERVGWDQQAPETAELSQYVYVLYVDGLPVALQGASCGSLSSEGLTAACSSQLPALQPGRHTLELATRITRGGVVLESARSAALVVTVAASASTLPASPPSQDRDAQRADAELGDAIDPGLDLLSAAVRTPDGLGPLTDGSRPVAPEFAAAQFGYLNFTPVDTAREGSAREAAFRPFAQTAVSRFNRLTGELVLVDSGAGVASHAVRRPGSRVTTARDAGSSDAVPGDLDGDGLLDDLLFDEPGAGHAGKWSTWRGDFDGDGRSDDLLLYDPHSGEAVLQIDSGSAARVAASGTWSPGWQLFGGDFNGDGRTDLLLYDANQGRRLLGLTRQAGEFVWTAGEAPADCQLAVGDVNCDELDDAVFYNGSDGLAFIAVSTLAADGHAFFISSDVWGPDWTLLVAPRTPALR